MLFPFLRSYVDGLDGQGNIVARRAGVYMGGQRKTILNVISFLLIKLSIWYILEVSFLLSLSARFCIYSSTLNDPNNFPDATSLSSLSVEICFQD